MASEEFCHGSGIDRIMTAIFSGVDAAGDEKRVDAGSLGALDVGQDAVADRKGAQR